MKIIVIDTETTNLEKPFCYNIGYVIFDTEAGEILVKKDFVVEQVWHNNMLFSTAYYANKREIYVERMRARKCRMDKFGYITQTMYRDIKEHDVQHGFAYNAPFDVKVFDFNCDWFKCINPLDTIQMHDIRGHVHKKIAFSESYQKYCNDHGLYTESGNYSTTAEAVFRYISNEDEFIEEHTALADSLIELEILRYCINLGCEWEQDYPTYRTIPRVVTKNFKVVDADGEAHVFPYTDKVKLRGEDGFRLKVKRE